jgi:hypothetical protein
LVSHPKGRKYIDDVYEQYAEETFWNRKLEKVV